MEIRKFDSEYDTIVVGGGPGGCLAAEYAARGGAKTLLLEKDRDIGYPVRCGEGVGEIGLKLVIEPSEKWIANHIKGAILVSPDGTKVFLRGRLEGYVLNRKLFDYELAVNASNAGAVICTKAHVTGVLKNNGQINGVTISYMNKKYEIRAKVVIGADGVESKVGRWAGLKTTPRMHDMETCAQASLANIKVDPDYCQFHFGNNMAPGGYAWIFPKSGNLANVGLGISGQYSGKRPALDYLKDFIHKTFPDSSVLSMIAGGVPCTNVMKKTVDNGIMLVGDAAHHPNPLTGGGIVNAMLAGKIAGEIAAQAVIEKDTSAAYLEKYSRQWRKTYGKDQPVFYRLKESVFNIKDEAFNSIARSINKIPPGKRTIAAVFKEALLDRPKLIFDVLKVFK